MELDKQLNKVMAAVELLKEVKEEFEKPAEVPEADITEDPQHYAAKLMTTYTQSLQGNKNWQLQGAIQNCIRILVAELLCYNGFSLTAKNVSLPLPSTEAQRFPSVFAIQPAIQQIPAPPEKKLPE